MLEFKLDLANEITLKLPQSPKVLSSFHLLRSPSAYPQFPYSKIIPILLVYDALQSHSLSISLSQVLACPEEIRRQVNPCIFNKL